MPLRDNLNIEEVRDLYGHELLENDIESLFPYDDRDFDKAAYSGHEYTVTYDPLTAMSLRLKHIPVNVWGQKYKNNHRAFVFMKNRPMATIF